MNLHRCVLAFAMFAPLSTAHAAIDIDGGTDEGGSTAGGGSTIPAPGTPTFVKSYSKSALFGSSSWGAGYKVNGQVSATPAYSTYKDKLAASMSLETYTKLNGSYNRLFSVRTAATTEAKRRTDLSLNAYVGSATIYTKSYTSATSTYTFMNVTPLSWQTTFFSKSINLSLGLIPVSFTVKATGELKANLTGKISNIGVEAAAAPSGKASLYASAAIGGQYCIDYVGCVGASAGVYSDVKLVEAAAPANVAAWWSLSPYGGVLVNYKAKADLTLRSLDGELGVFADACLIGCIHESVKLIEWAGFGASYAIANLSGNKCLIGYCGPQQIGF